MNKAETVIALQVDKYDENVSTVTAGFCRNKSFKPFAFEITDDGLPKIIEDYVIQSKSKKGFDVLTLDPIDKFQLLKEVFKNGKVKPKRYTRLWQKIPRNVPQIPSKISSKQ